MFLQIVPNELVQIDGFTFLFIVTAFWKIFAYATKSIQKYWMMSLSCINSSQTRCLHNLLQLIWNMIQ